MRLQVGLLTASSNRYWRQWQVCFVSLLYIVMYSQCTPETGEMVVYICTPRTRTIVISVGFRDHRQQQLYLQPPPLTDNFHLTDYHFFSCSFFQTRGKKGKPSFNNWLTTVMQNLQYKCKNCSAEVQTFIWIHITTVNINYWIMSPCHLNGNVTSV